MDKVVLITGASSGMGFATLEQLVSEGHTVYASGRKKEDLQTIEQAGGKPLHIEMTDAETMQAAVDRIMEEQGRIDVVFNNAGYGLYGPVEEVPRPRYLHQFEVNVFGHAEMTRIVVPIMRRQGGGRLIYTGSMGGRIFTPLGAWYHATKHALEGWTDCLRLEVKDFNIQVILIEPGFISTRFGEPVAQSLGAMSPDGAYGDLLKRYMDRMIKLGPRMQGSDPSVIAKAVSRAIRANRPRSRYMLGRAAKPLWLTRRWLGDRAYERLVTRLTR